jgi:hypothetical protein
VKYLVYFSVILLCFGCKTPVEEDTQEIKISYYVPESSEMSKLMNYMYAHNLGIKEDIKKGTLPSDFPEHFLTIHTAELSEFKQRQERFENFSEEFIKVEKELYNKNSVIPLQLRYNNAINLCISCHQKECPGPVTKIKKLLIE